MQIMDWESRAERLETRWDSADGRRWRIVFRAVELDGRLEPVGFDIRSWPRDRHADPCRLLSEHLREMRLAELFIVACRGHAAQLAGEVELMRETDTFIDGGSLGSGQEAAVWSGEDLAAETATRAQRALTAGRRGGQIGRGSAFTHEQLEQAAGVYLAAYRAHRPPQKAVAETLGVPRSQAGSIIKRCRAVGLLPETTRGRAKGWPAESKEGTP